MVSALIVAAGKGTRMGQSVDKLFLEVAGRPVLAHTWQQFEQAPSIQEIILVYPLDADIARRRVSVLTPVGAALLGLSINQTISFRTRTGERRELTVLKVSRAV